MLGPPVVPLLSPLFGEGSPTGIDYREKGTLILTSLLEDLVCVAWSHSLAWDGSSSFAYGLTTTLRVPIQAMRIANKVLTMLHVACGSYSRLVAARSC